MTGFAFTPTPDNQLLRRFGGDLLPATLGETLEATVEDPTLSPLSLLFTQAEIARESGGIRSRDRRIAPRGQVFNIEEDPDLSPMVSAEELNAEFGDTGAKFDKPTRRRVAEIIAEQKLEERIRSDVLSRGPTGILPGAARFGAAFVRTAIDPLNVAASFIPVVGPARFAGMVSRVGKTGARFSRGFIEGAVGNAVIEPGVFLLARSQQLDYEMSDALLNVALGGFVGGGFHVGAGKVGDLIERARPETREAALRGSVAQVAQGRQVNIGPIVASDPALALTSRRDLLSTTAAVERDGRFVPEIAEPVEALPATGILRVGGAIGVDGRAQPVQFADAAHRDLFDFAEQLDREGPRSPAVREKRKELFETFRGFVEDQPDIARFRRASDVDGLAREFREEVLDDARNATADRELEVASVVDPDLQADFQAHLVGRLGGRRIAPEAADAIRDVRARSSARLQAEQDRIAEFARLEAQPERDITADFEAASRAEEALQRFPGDIDESSAQAEADFIEAQILQLRAQNAVDAATERELESLADMVAQSEAYGRAAQAAAVCLTRRA